MIFRRCNFQVFNALLQQLLDDDSVTHKNPKDSSYYASEEWQQEIDAALNTVNLPQPSQQSSSSVATTQQQSVLISQ